MEYKLKPISHAGINEAISKVELYRYLNEPGEAESICRDILTLEPEHQAALRLLGLAITDQFTGGMSDRYAEADHIFRSLTNEYERAYYTGILHERKAKAQLRAGRPPHTVTPIRSRAEMLRRGREDQTARQRRCDPALESMRAIASEPDGNRVAKRYG
jgi:hypothetical protein